MRESSRGRWSGRLPVDTPEAGKLATVSWHASPVRVWLLLVHQTYRCVFRGGFVPNNGSIGETGAEPSDACPVRPIFLNAPHPPPRRAISGDLGASLARRHTCSKKEGPGWSHGAHEDVLARFSPPRPAPLGPVRRRPARRVPRPVTPTPARTAHLQPSRGYSCAHAGEPGGTPFPPPPTG